MHPDLMFAETCDAGDEGGPRPAYALRKGDVINGRYRVDAVLGAGGMGLVYRVTDHLHPDRRVALKTIATSSIRPGQLGPLKAEFANMSRLHHPNVAEVYDFEPMRGSDEHFFTMECVTGRNLRAATEGLGWKGVLDLLVQVCRALSYLHSRETIHCDLKPSNVLVDDAGRVKVLDFGVAVVAGRGGQAGRSGTPAYMSPERFMSTDWSRAEIDHRSDLYSLGVMAYEVLCRRLPFFEMDVYWSPAT